MDLLKTQLRELSKGSTALVVLAVAIPLALLIGEVWGVRFTTHDDAHFALQTRQAERWAQSLHLATTTGRAFFLYYMPFLYLPISNWQTPVYDFIQYGSFALAFLMVAWVAYAYVSRRFAFVFALSYIATLALKWDHTLITSNPLFLHFHTIVLCASLLCLRRALSAGQARWRNASLILLAISVIGLEFQTIIAPILYLLAARAALTTYSAHDQPASRRTFVTLLRSVLAIVGVYLLVAIAWRVYFGSQYGGVTPNLASFDLRAALGIVVNWTLSGNVFFHWFSAPVVQFVAGSQHVGAAGSILIPIRFFSSMPLAAAAVGLVTSLALAIVLLEKQPEPSTTAPAGWRWLPLPFLVIALTPSMLLAVTTKYQQWFSVGVMSYAYTSISAYGVALLFSWVALSALSLVDSTAFRVAVTAALCLLLGAGAATCVVHNAAVAATMHDGAARWRAIDVLLRSPLRARAEGSVIVAPRLESYYWSVPGREGYWAHLGRSGFGANITVTYDVNRVDWGSATNVYYLDFFRSERTNEVAVLLLPLTRADNVVKTGREGWMASRRPMSVYVSSTGVSGKKSHSLVSADWQEERRFAVHAVTLPDEPEFADVSIEDRLMWAPLRQSASRRDYWIDFSRAGNAALFKTGPGWSGQEPKHTWAIGNESHLQIRAPRQAACDLEGELDASAFAPPGRGRQRLEMAVNDQTVWRGEIAERTQVKFQIPMRVWNDRRPVQVRFSHPDAVSPATTLGQPDDRKLAISFFQITVTECATPAKTR